MDASRDVDEADTDCMRVEACSTGHAARPADSLASGQASARPAEPNGWNGTFVNAEDTYALMRDCNANARYDPVCYVPNYAGLLMPLSDSLPNTISGRISLGSLSILISPPVPQT